MEENRRLQTQIAELQQEFKEKQFMQDRSKLSSADTKSPSLQASQSYSRAF